MGVLGLGFWVLGLGFRVLGLGCRGGMENKMETAITGCLGFRV